MRGPIEPLMIDEMEKRPIFITGGTGFLGSVVTRRALERGYSVRLFSRRSTGYSPSMEAGHIPTDRVERVKGDITRPIHLRKAMEGTKAVIHLVGIIREGDHQTFDTVHRRGTINIVDAARDAGVNRLIYISALGSDVKSPILYHRTKGEAEAYIRSSPLEATILRPSVIFGPRDGFINLLAKITKHSPVVPIVGDGKTKLQPIWVEDVAEITLRALEREKTVGKTYDLGGPDPLSLDEIIDIILEITGRKKPRLHLPIPLMKPVATMMENLLREPPLTKDQLRMMGEDNVCDIRVMMRDFDIDPASLRDIIPGYIA